MLIDKSDGNSFNLLNMADPRNTFTGHLWMEYYPFGKGEQVK